jgi:hypothetical protein
VVWTLELGHSCVDFGTFRLDYPTISCLLTAHALNFLMYLSLQFFDTLASIYRIISSNSCLSFFVLGPPHDMHHEAPNRS